MKIPRTLDLRWLVFRLVAPIIRPFVEEAVKDGVEKLKAGVDRLMDKAEEADKEDKDGNSNVSA